MIKVKNINGRPETTPDTNGGVHSDSEFFYFFETEQEFNEFIAALPVVWDKETYFLSITKQIQEIVDSKAREFDYDDIKDVPTENFDGGVYQQEAINLLTWASNLWLLRDAYFKTVNSEQDINSSFIETLPQFNNNG